MDAAHVLEGQISVLRLNGERGHDAVVGLTEELNAQIEVERAVFDYAVGREDIGHLRMANDRRLVQVCDALNPVERAVLLAPEIAVGAGAVVTDAVSFAFQPKLFAQSETSAGDVAQRVLLFGRHGDAILA